MKLSKIAIFIAAFAYAGFCLGQETDNLADRTVLDDSPVASPRASGMGGAASGVSTNTEAFYHNPAGIGGLEYSDRSYPTIRQLHFPYVGISANQESVAIQQEFSEQGAATNSTLADAIVQANAGKRVYARFSMFPNLVLGRIMLGAIVDNQLAAVPTGEENLVQLRYRETLGLAGGFSLTNSKRTVFFGLSAAYMNRLETEGQFSYSAIDNRDQRDEIINSASTAYDGVPMNMGILWRMSKKWRPSLSIVAKDLGGTDYIASSNDIGQDFTEKQKLTVGFSIFPYESKRFLAVTTMQLDDIENSGESVHKKFKFGTELLFGSDLQRPLMGVRAGYNSAGMSFGAHLDFGLIGGHISSYAEDVGENNKRVVDRRYEISLKIDVSEH